MGNYQTKSVYEHEREQKRTFTMGMNSIQGGGSAIFIRQMMEGNTKRLNQSMQKLASGYRINRSADDAAGLQISENLRSQMRGMEMAQQNIADGTSVLNIADGATSTMADNLQRVRELAVQGANDTLNTDQRNAINTEMQSLVADINRVAGGTEFNGKSLFAAGASTFKIQVGAGAASATNTIDIGAASALGALNASSLGIATGSTRSIGVSTGASALQSISKIDAAIATLGNRRSAIGAMTNRLDSASSNLGVAIENVAASESRVRNVDVAKESANLVRHQILQQASAGMLPQANNQGSFLLNLIR
jgi:flagellin